MVCSHSLYFQISKLRTTFGLLLCLATLTATVCNILVLIIIVRLKRRSPSNRISLSLAVADVLVGVLLGPLTIAQVLDIKMLENCSVDAVRAYFLVFLLGSSLLTLAVLSYDRYLLLKKRSNYNQYMTKRKAALLIAFSWILPGLTPIAKYINKSAFFIICICLMSFSLGALTTFYFLITKEVRKRENKLTNCNNIIVSKDSQTSTSETTYHPSISTSVTEPTICAHLKLEKPASKETSVKIHLSNVGKTLHQNTLASEKSLNSVITEQPKSSNGISCYQQLSHAKLVKKVTNVTLLKTTNHPKNLTSRKRFSHTVIAKSVSLLIVCCLICILPANIWMILEMTKLNYSKLAKQIFYLCAIIQMQFSSCINPVIYFSKQKDIKIGFRKLFTRKTYLA